MELAGLAAATAHLGMGIEERDNRIAQLEREVQLLTVDNDGYQRRVENLTAELEELRGEEEETEASEGENQEPGTHSDEQVPGPDQV